jgi:hypothetical protein
VIGRDGHLIDDDDAIYLFINKENKENKENECITISHVSYYVGRKVA